MRQLFSSLLLTFERLEDFTGLLYGGNFLEISWYLYFEAVCTPLPFLFVAIVTFRDASKPLD